MKTLIQVWVLPLYLILFAFIPSKTFANSAPNTATNLSFLNFSSPFKTPFVIPEGGILQFKHAKYAVPAVNFSEDVTQAKSEITDNCDKAGPSEIKTLAQGLCPGQIIDYFIDVNPDHSNYEWDVPRASAGEPPTGWVILSGQGTHSVRVKVGEKWGTMKIKVNHKTCGTKVRTMVVKPKECSPCPAPTATLTGPANVCNLSDTTYTYSVENARTDVVYQFNLPEGFEIVDQTSTSVSVVIVVLDADRIGEQQLVTVTASNQCGTTTASLSVTVSECSEGDPLPVHLTKFEGVSKNGQVELAWSTASEINNDRFEIQRSRNGLDFTTIAEVRGAGNSNTQQDYGYVDRQASFGQVYYRLNQIDLNNAQELSKVIVVMHARPTNAAGLLVKMYPNPVTEGNLTIRLEGLPAYASETITVKILDLNGKVLYSRNMQPDAQELNVGLASLGLKQGLYMVSLSAGNEAQVHRIVIH